MWKDAKRRRRRVILNGDLEMVRFLICFFDSTWMWRNVVVELELDDVFFSMREKLYLVVVVVDFQ